MRLFILYPPNLSVSDLVFKLKGTSSVIIRNRNYPSVKLQL
ncbi:transposase [Succinatimonas hippei]